MTSDPKQKVAGKMSGRESSMKKDKAHSTSVTESLHTLCSLYAGKDKGKQELT